MRSALTKLESNSYEPALIATGPADSEGIEVSTADGSGQYVFASSPVDRAERKLWGTQVVISTAVAAGTVVVLAAGAVKLYTDGRVDVEWHVDGDGFEKKTVRARCEYWYQVAVTQPLGVVKVTLRSGE